MKNLDALIQKTENGVTLYFYPGIGWCTAERLNQPDIQGLENYKSFMYNPKNAFNCGECPENREMNSDLPCGQQNCWVTCHCSRK